MQTTENTQKNKLTETVWSKEEYYQVARKGSQDFKHPAMIELTKLSQNAEKILDMGCGEGTRLAKITSKGQKGFGIDISPKAVELAQKKYPNLTFKVGDLEHLPFQDGGFDLIYSAYVFEHLKNPEKVVKEGIRVLKKNGSFLIVAPNYGAPGRSSPPFKGNRILKLVKGFFRDVFPADGLNWQKVEPIIQKEKFEIDWDAATEPYLGSLIRFLKRNGMKVTYHSSCWGQEDPKASVLQKIFRFFGEMNIYPFSNWGPHLLVVGEK